MKTFLILVLLCATSLSVIAQSSPLVPSLDTRTKRDISGQLRISSGSAGPGSVLLNSGDEVKGVIVLDQDGRVKVVSGNDQRIFWAHELVALEYYDSMKSRQRIYLSLEIEEPGQSYAEKEFLEVLRQYENFAVVKQEDPMEVTHQTRRSYQPTNPNSATTTTNRTVSSRRDRVLLEKTATIFLVKYEEKAKPYLQVTFKDANVISGIGLNQTKEKGKILDKDLLKEFFGAEYQKIQSVTRSTGLDLNDEDELLKIFDKIWGK